LALRAGNPQSGQPFFDLVFLVTNNDRLLRLIVNESELFGSSAELEL